MSDELLIVVCLYVFWERLGCKSRDLMANTVTHDIVDKPTTCVNLATNVRKEEGSARRFEFGWDVTEGRSDALK